GNLGPVRIDCTASKADRHTPARACANREMPSASELPDPIKRSGGVDQRQPKPTEPRLGAKKTEPLTDHGFIVGRQGSHGNSLRQQRPLVQCHRSTIQLAKRSTSYAAIS